MGVNFVITMNMISLSVSMIGTVSLKISFDSVYLKAEIVFFGIKNGRGDWIILIVFNLC